MLEENVTQNLGSDQTEAQVSSQKTAELEACKGELHEMQARVRYLVADFDNYRRNAEKDRALWYGKAQAVVLLDLLSLVDDFDRAFESRPQQLDESALQSIQSWVSGFDIMRQNFAKVLEKYDVKEMPTTGDFDPERHEALQQIVSADHRSGEIVNVIRKGYLCKGGVLRPALVAVAQ